MKTFTRFVFGYTLIELMVVISISALLFFAVLVTYQRFNKNQALQAGAQEVKALLRDVQNRAISGEKDIGFGFCTGTLTSLKGWKFEWGGTTYSIYGVCTDGVIESSHFGAKDFTLPATDNIHFTTSGTLLFLPVQNGVDKTGAPNSICIEGNSSSNSPYKITIETNGEINVDKITVPPACS